MTQEQDKANKPVTLLFSQEEKEAHEKPITSDPIGSAIASVPDGKGGFRDVEYTERFPGTPDEALKEQPCRKNQYAPENIVWTGFESDMKQKPHNIKVLTLLFSGESKVANKKSFSDDQNVTGSLIASVPDGKGGFQDVEYTECFPGTPGKALAWNGQRQNPYKAEDIVWKGRASDVSYQRGLEDTDMTTKTRCAPAPR